MTEVFGLPRERLWVTVFGGSPRFEADDEASAVWRDEIGVAPNRILGLASSSGASEVWSIRASLFPGVSWGPSVH